MSIWSSASLNLRHIKLPHFCYKPASSEFGICRSSNSFIMNSQEHSTPHCSNPLFPPANQSVAAIIFGDDGGSSHLYPLTKRRSEGAIPIGGNYRLIDAVVSNCINSDITKIYAITQFNSTSLNSHLSRAYSTGSRLSKDGFVEVIAAYQSPEGKGWFQGSADAIRRCLWVVEEYGVLEFLVLPGHHLYKMDYQKLIDAHRRSKADITVSVLSGTRTDHSINVEDDHHHHHLGCGIYRVSAENRVLEYKENSAPMLKNLANFKDSEDESGNYPGMGIYVMNRDIMIQLLTKYFPFANDLKSEVIPGAISLGMHIHAYKFDGYWEDMKSIEAYYRANMEMIQRTNKAYNLYEKDSPLYTLPRHLPPSLIADALIADSVIGDGCILSRCKIKGSVLGMRTRICDAAIIEDSVIMGSEAYHQHGRSEGEGIGIPPIGIGEGSHIREAIIDKNARIGRNVMIINRDNVQESDMEADGYIITGGIIVIIRGAVIPDGTIL